MIPLPIITLLAMLFIMAVKFITYPVAKESLKKIQACRDSNPDLCDTGAAL